MSDRTAKLMRLCFEKIELDGEDAVFFQNVMNAPFETRHESECRARLEEAGVVPADETDCFFAGIPSVGWRRPTRSAAGEVQRDTRIKTDQADAR